MQSLILIGLGRFIDLLHLVVKHFIFCPKVHWLFHNRKKTNEILLVD